LNTSRLAYRVNQFWRSLFSTDQVVQAEFLHILSPAQGALFQRMQPSEQAHALSVLKHLQDNGEDNPDLLVAAILHDIGKINQPLSTFGRILIVLGNHFFPQAVQRWGKGAPTGWRRPFVVATQHAAWGADLASTTGASPMTVNLIRRHQDSLHCDPGSLEDRLLVALRSADDSN
jgi:hypothetical protein